MNLVSLKKLNKKYGNLSSVKKDKEERIYLMLFLYMTQIVLLLYEIVQIMNCQQSLVPYKWVWFIYFRKAWCTRPLFKTGIGFSFKKSGVNINCFSIELKLDQAQGSKLTCFTIKISSNLAYMRQLSESPPGNYRTKCGNHTCNIIYLIQSNRITLRISKIWCQPSNSRK